MKTWLRFLSLTLAAVIGFYCINAFAISVSLAPIIPTGPIVINAPNVIAPTNNTPLAGGTGAAVKTGTAWCYSLIQKDPTAFIKPLIQCFTDTSQGIIPSVTLTFVNKVQQDYFPIVATMFILAIAWYGFKMLTGDVQRIKGETVVLGLKIAGIFYFMNNAGYIYIDMISILQNMSALVAQAAVSVHTKGFCTYAIGTYAGNGDATWASSLWERWDCIFQYLLGLSGHLAEDGIAAFLFLMMFSMGTGILIFFMGLYLIFALLMAAFRFIHVYLMAVLSLSFMFCLGYIFVPLLLFKNTFEYFKKWLTLVLGFVITPIVMFGFMGLMLVALDISLFTGQYSVWCMIGGADYCGAKGAPTANGGTDSGSIMFSDMTQVTDASVLLPTYNPDLKDHFQGMFWVALNGPQNETNVPSAGNDCTQQNGGWMGFLCNMSESGSSYQSSIHSSMAQVGLDQPGLNLPVLASGITDSNGTKHPGPPGATCKEVQNGTGLPDPLNPLALTSGDNTYYTNCTYAENILIALCVAALLTYIMFALINYIPTLASNLTADLLSQDMITSGGNLLQSRPMGESTGRGLLDAAKASSTAALKGGESGGLSGAVSGGSQAGWRAISSMLERD